MKWLDKVLGRNKGGHDQWLEDHPGKGSMTLPPAHNASYDPEARERMEKELAGQREKMSQK